MPIFWFGIILQIVFYKRLDLLPIGGRLGILDTEPPQVTGFYLIDTLLAGDLQTFVSALVHLILPAATLAAGSLAVVTRMMRASVIEVLDADHVRTARAKGLSPVSCCADTSFAMRLFQPRPYWVSRSAPCWLAMS